MAEQTVNLKLYELINPSDCYTFRAPNIKIAGCCVAFLSTGFGAKCLDEDNDESTPVLFGWNEWLVEQGIDDAFVTAHSLEIADAWDSFLIGSASHRRDIEELLEKLPPEEREKARNERQDRNRSSLNRIGERAYMLAKHYREAASNGGL